MKKIFTLFAVVMMAATGAMAQTWYVGGGVNLALTGSKSETYRGADFRFGITPTAGYEFNEKWAIEFGGNLGTNVYGGTNYWDGQPMPGLSGKSSVVNGGVFAYGRYTAWSNGLLFLDLKFGDEYLGGKNINRDYLVFMPQLRVRVHDHVDLGLTCGRAALGLEFAENETTFVYDINLNVGLNCVYRF